MLSSLIPGLDAASAATGPEIAHFTLANGLDVVVIPDRRAPVVTHMVWYRVGGADEPMGKSGIAHFLEHLMFKGTEKQPGGFSREVARLGGQENAFTSYDYTAYFQRVARPHLGTMMGFEADRMAGLALSDAVVDPERSVVLEERKMRVDNDPDSQLGEEVAATLFTHHPYGTPIIGWEEEIKGLTRQDAVAFHDRFYTPNNAILVVAGDVTAEEVRALAEDSYGRLARRAEPPPRLRPQEPPQRADRRVSLADPRVEQPMLQRHWRVPSYRTANDGEAHALDLLAQVLGGGSVSRLYRALVAEQKITASAAAWYGGTAVDESRFAVWAAPLPGVSFATVEAAISAVIAELAEKGIGEAELDRAKTRLVAEAIYARDSQSSLARYFGSTLAVGGTVADLQAWPARIAAITPDAVREAARRHLAEARSVVGLLEGAD
ncbi:M16 family metallopeptidase [Labrys wisconsinensis]|uniref:Zinc protease n=1 Tax=Labrys wisconsinensis TaxID=425677 RepID=A0ABU0JN82_9HYPH|nr:pitrilysin family protein [Labrys wisconsinensis]MDQ0474961.1 zinc protease [Labrys wisconsinensis]